jgi:hypothetical protein
VVEVVEVDVLLPPLQAAMPSTMAIRDIMLRILYFMDIPWKGMVVVRTLYRDM